MSLKDKIHIAISPTTYFISKGAELAVEKVQELSQNGTIQQIKEEYARQELLAQMRTAQAKVAQELAIAQRISTAEIVEIEEFYDGSSKGGLDVQVTEASITGGITGEGRKVTKRIYRFTGWHEGAAQLLEEQYNQVNLDD